MAIIKATTGGGSLVSPAGGHNILYGTAQRDYLTAVSYDTLYGGDGDDWLTGGNRGHNNLYGEAGNDFIRVGGDSNIVHGGDGNDAVNIDEPWADLTNTKIYGDAGNDNIGLGISVNDVGLMIDGGDGNDTIAVNVANFFNAKAVGTMMVYGGAGNDTITIANMGRAVIDGGSGDDAIYLSNDWDDVTLGSGRDTLTLLSTGTVVIVEDFTPSDDVIAGFGKLVPNSGTNPFDTGRARLVQVGPDTIVQITAYAGGAFQTLITLRNVDAHALTAANFGGFAPDTIVQGNAILQGTGGNDLLTGTAGDDYIQTLGGHDIVDGGAGTDTLIVPGARAAYTVLTSGNFTFLVDGNGEAIRLTNIEEIEFSDATLSLDALTLGAPALDGLEYIASNPDLIKGLGADAAAGIQHYLKFGFYEGRTTDSFDALQYLDSNPDLLRAFGDDPVAAERHYIDYGFAEGRTTTGFDAMEYLASNPDLLRAFGDDPVAAERHYIDYGFAEGRSTTSFDAMEYLASNPDLIRAFGTDTQAAEQHYVDYGFAEGRATTSFDAMEYLASNPDLIRGLGDNLAAAEQHYVQYGFDEGRAVASFDAVAYAAVNLDLAKAFGSNAAALEQHYVDHGFAEGRATGGFDAVAYELTYQDLGQAGLTPSQALLHWVQHGFAEGRVGDALYGREQTNHDAPVGTTTTDVLGTPTDHDWFQTSLTAGQRIDLSLTGAGFDAELQIFDSHGVLLAQAAASMAGTAAATTFTASWGGTYYLGVSSTDNHGGSYTLAVANHH